MHIDIHSAAEGAAKPLKKDDLLSFKPVGRPLALEQVPDEFARIKEALGKPLTPAIAQRICEKSGSHLIKLVSPRVDGDHATLRFNDPTSNQRVTVLPSVNAPDIPFCKVIFRPLEVTGQDVPMSVVDHILNPVEGSESVLSAFASVFGQEVLALMKTLLTSAPASPTKLAAGEFPIIFVPRPGGGDLQITPVSPAATFMGMKRVTDHYFQKVTPEAPRPPRGRWTKQSISSKPQNISGAIGGPRVRFLATMPPSMQQNDAELYRYLQGGSFPRWRDEEVAIWVLRYADMLEADTTFNNKDTRAALDRTADRMICDAADFIDVTLADAADMAALHDSAAKTLPPSPSLAQVLIRRRWPTDADHARARKILSSPHFEDRVRKSRAAQEVLA